MAYLATPPSTVASAVDRQHQHPPQHPHRHTAARKSKFAPGQAGPLRFRRRLASRPVQRVSVCDRTAGAPIMCSRGSCSEVGGDGEASRAVFVCFFVCRAVRAVVVYISGVISGQRHAAAARGPLLLPSIFLFNSKWNCHTTQPRGETRFRKNRPPRLRSQKARETCPVFTGGSSL